MRTISLHPLLGLVAVGIALGAISLTGCSRVSEGSGTMPPPTVTVAQPIRKEIVEWDAYTGRLEPIDFVEIRARVSGYLQSTHFKEGQMVQEGDLLFVVDPRPYEAALTGAKAKHSEAVSQLAYSKAQLEQAKALQVQTGARLTLAQARIERARSLREKNAVAQDELDQREAEYEQALADVTVAEAGIASAQAAIETATAAVESAKASIETAELELSYTRIVAPVTGRISHKYVTEGNLVNGGSATATLLTTIASVEPIYCTFDVNEQLALKYIRLAQAGKRQSSREAKNPVFLGLSDEKGFPHQGHMQFVDNRFDTDTGSMRVRCVFRNDDHTLVPGMFARVRLPGSASYEAVLIPDAAIGTDQSTQYVYIVSDGVIERRTVTLGPIVDGLRVVREGLDGSETLVVEGLLQARPGVEVQTETREVYLVDDGLPNSYEPLTPERWILPELAAVPTAIRKDRRTFPKQEGSE